MWMNARRKNRAASFARIYLVVTDVTVESAFNFNMTANPVGGMVSLRNS